MHSFVVRLVVQRTKLIDETQEILLELLEEMTTGRCYVTRAELTFQYNTYMKNVNHLIPGEMVTTRSRFVPV